MSKRNSTGAADLDSEAYEALTVKTICLTGEQNGIRIRADMLPSSTWGSNLRGILRDSEWKRLRIATSDAAGEICEVCQSASHGPFGKVQRPDCHELWTFEREGDHLVQRLVRLIALCKACHAVQHTGRASSIGTLPEVVATLRRLNEWTEAEANADIDRAFDRFDLMNGLAFDLDLSTLLGRVCIGGYFSLIIPAAEREQLGNSYERSMTDLTLF